MTIKLFLVNDHSLTKLTSAREEGNRGSRLSNFFKGIESYRQVPIKRKAFPVEGIKGILVQTWFIVPGCFMQHLGIEMKNTTAASVSDIQHISVEPSWVDESIMTMLALHLTPNRDIHADHIKQRKQVRNSVSHLKCLFFSRHHTLVNNEANFSSQEVFFVVQELLQNGALRVSDLQLL